MAIEVLLMSKIDGLGIEGDVVTVKDGYARNYLFPQELAAEVTAGKKRQIEAKRNERLAEMAKEVEAAKELASKLADVSCTIAVKTNEEGKLFGSVDATDIAAKIAEQGFVLDKATVVLDESIKELGFFDIQIAFHPEVSATVKVSVVDENA